MSPRGLLLRGAEDELHPCLCVLVLSSHVFLIHRSQVHISIFGGRSDISGNTIFSSNVQQERFWQTISITVAYWLMGLDVQYLQYILLHFALDKLCRCTYTTTSANMRNICHWLFVVCFHAPVPVSTFFITQSMFTCAVTVKVLQPLTYSRLFTHQRRHEKSFLSLTLALCIAQCGLIHVSSLHACLDDEMPAGNTKINLNDKDAKQNKEKGVFFC